MMFIKRIVAIVLSVILAVSATVYHFVWGDSVVIFDVDASKTGENITNIADNVNLWDMGTQFYDAKKNEKNDVFEFVKYVQLMQCTGGTPERDLFKDPYDTSTYTDYDFTRLIKNCQGILNVGAKPHLKLGGVPIKFTTGYEYGGFGMNPYPPDDYNAYYEYIKAIAQALVDEFGLEEVKTWRFGCMTEFENSDWFMAKSKSPEESCIAYCKLYDYTVQALIDVIGDDVFVGAHCMGVTEGLWDEMEFLKHVAQGTNYATGEKGSHIDFLSASYYDPHPGKFTGGMKMPELCEYLRKGAENYGLNDLIFGIDEGRVLSSSNKELLSRATGFTWQAAYDARIFKQAIDGGLDYFSSWYYLTGGLFDGAPVISYHVANNISKFEGSKRADVDRVRLMSGAGIESDCLAGWNEETETLRLMAYNFKNSLKYDKDMKLTFNIDLPQLDGKEVTVVKYLVNDDCNFFDEWMADREKYSITDDCFAWSQDDPMLDSTVTLADERARKIYFEELRDKYIECAQLTPVESKQTVENGKLTIEEKIEAGNVVFYEIY